MVAEKDEHGVAGLVMLPHTQIVVVHAATGTQHGLQPLPLTVVDGTIGVAGPVGGVQADTGHAFCDREGVVTAYRVEVIFAETVTMRTCTINILTQVSLD